jgi:isoleucyl-tRNA synthetase
MGCDQSTPLHVDPTFVAYNTKSVSPSNVTTSSHGGGRKAASSSLHGNTKQLMSASSRSRTNASDVTTTTANNTLTTSVSLEVDEEVTYSIPKVDHNGNLLAEEIVRRTSSSLQCTSLTVGSTKKGAKVVHMEVCRDLK